MTDDVRDGIIASATALFAENGFAKTSMNDIVRASGLSKGGVYWHFSGKDEIINAIFTAFFEAQITAFSAIIAQDGLSATNKLWTLMTLGGQELETFAAQFPSSLEFYALAARESGLRQQLQHYFALYRGQFQQLVMQGIAEGEWRDVDPIHTADTLITLIEGALLMYGIMPETFHPEAQLKSALTLLLEGIKRNPS